MYGPSRQAVSHGSGLSRQLGYTVFWFKIWLPTTPITCEQTLYIHRRGPISVPPKLNKHKLLWNFSPLRQYMTKKMPDSLGTMVNLLLIALAVYWVALLCTCLPVTSFTLLFRAASFADILRDAIIAGYVAPGEHYRIKMQSSFKQRK